YANRRCPCRTNFFTVYLTPSLAAGVDPGPSDGFAVEPELAAAAPNASTAVATARTNQKKRRRCMLALLFRGTIPPALPVRLARKRGVPRSRPALRPGTRLERGSGRRHRRAAEPLARL